MKTLLVINFLRLIDPEIIIKKLTLAHHKENENQFHRPQGRGLLSQEMTNKAETIPMPTFARRPSTMSSIIRWIFRRILWLDSTDSKFWSCNSTNSQIHNHSWFGRYDSKIKLLLVLIFHRTLRYGSTKWRWLIHERNLSLRDQFAERTCQMSRCWTGRLLLL